MAGYAAVRSRTTTEQNETELPSSLLKDSENMFPGTTALQDSSILPTVNIPVQAPVPYVYHPERYVSRECYHVIVGR